MIHITYIAITKFCSVQELGNSKTKIKPRGIGEQAETKEERGGDVYKNTPHQKMEKAIEKNMKLCS